MDGGSEAANGAPAGLSIAAMGPVLVALVGVTLIILSGPISRAAVAINPAWVKRPFGADEGAFFFNRVVVTVIGAGWLGAGLVKLF